MSAVKHRKHVLSLEDVESYEFEHIIAAQHGQGASKSLAAWVGNGHDVHYKVYSHRKMVFVSSALRSAIEAYNDIG
jgi:hypothetical protein